MKIDWHEVDAQHVWRYFIAGYDLKNGERIATHEAFYDATKGSVIFKLYIEEKAEQTNENKTTNQDRIQTD